MNFDGHNVPTPRQLGQRRRRARERAARLAALDRPILVDSESDSEPVASAANVVPADVGPASEWTPVPDEWDPVAEAAFWQQGAAEAAAHESDVEAPASEDAHGEDASTVDDDEEYVEVESSWCEVARRYPNADGAYDEPEHPTGIRIVVQGAALGRLRAAAVVANAASLPIDEFVLEDYAASAGIQVVLRGRVLDELLREMWSETGVPSASGRYELNVMDD